MSVAETREKVQRMLTEMLGSVEVDRDGDFTLRHGSTRIFIVVDDFGPEGQTSVEVFAYLLLNVPPSDDLFRYVATENRYKIGKLWLTPEKDDGTYRLRFEHTLYGRTLDPEELQATLFIISKFGDDLDTELMGRFGGRTVHDDPEQGDADA